jgi:ribosomal RNA assembly protein
MFQQEIKIPKDRIAVLIGKKGEIRRLLERKLKIKMAINSKTGDVVLSGEDSLSLYVGRNIVHAIGRGFNPDIALLLLNEDFCFEQINLEDYSRGKKERLVILRSRLIGSRGLFRKTIEKLTDCYIVIYGKTVSIIGRVENIFLAKRAIENLLRGSPHGKVYKSVERLKKKK